MGDRLIGFLAAIGEFAVTAAEERHAFLSRFIDYLLSTGRALYVLFFIAAGLGLAESGFVWTAIVTAILLPLFIWWQRAAMKPSDSLVVIYEMVVWISIINVVADVLMLVQGVAMTDFRTDFTADMLSMARVVILSYILIDLRKPPRKRKKLKLLPSKSKPAYEGMIT